MSVSGQAQSPLDPRAAPAVATLVDEAAAAERAGQREIARRCSTKPRVCACCVEEPARASAIIRRIARSYMRRRPIRRRRSTASTPRSASSEAHRRHCRTSPTPMNLMATTNLLTRGDLDEAEPLYARALALAVETARASARGDGGAEPRHRSRACAAISAPRSSTTRRASSTYRTLGHAAPGRPRAQQHGARLHAARPSRRSTSGVRRSARALRADGRRAAPAARADRTPRDLLARRAATSMRAAALCDTVLPRRPRRATSARSARRTSISGSSRAMRGDLDGAERHLERGVRQRDAPRGPAARRRDGARAGRAVRADGQESRDAAGAVAVAPSVHEARAQRNLADLRQRVGRLETRFYDVVARWAQTIESKDAYTLGHCERVADYACALARDIGLRRDDDVLVPHRRAAARRRQDRRADGDPEQARPADARRATGHGAARRGRRRAARGHRISVGHPADGPRPPRAVGRRRISRPSRGRRHRARGARRVRRRRVRRADDGPPLSPRDSRAPTRWQ